MAVLALFTIVLHLLGIDSYLVDEHGIRYQTLLVVAVFFGFGGSFLSLMLSKKIAIHAMRVRVIERPNSELEAWLLRTVGNLSRQAGITTPEVGVYESADPNAFATGPNKNSSLVAVSTGLLRTMPRDQVEAVLAHEVSHCANGDMVTLALMQGVLNTFVIFISRVIGITVDRVVFRNTRGVGLGYIVVTLAAQFALGILASIILAAFSRRREFRADSGAAKLVGPRPMAAALDSLRRVSTPAAMPESMRAFGIRGGTQGLLASLLRSHPPLEDRIARLRNAGG